MESAPSPSDLLQLWRERVEGARRQYERAVFVAAQATERMGCEATTDEIKALIETHDRESAALAEYMRLLKTFHYLVIRAEKPEA